MSKVKLTKQQVKDLASLSKIKLTKQEEEKFTTDMDTILSSVETLNDFQKDERDNIAPLKSDEIPFCSLREDKTKTSMNQEDVLANAPHKENGYFKVHGDVFDEDNS